jgi:hypothetical protein
VSSHTGLDQAARDGRDDAMKTAGTEKQRSTEQRNTVTMGVAATRDSTSEWRELGAQVNAPKCVSVAVMRPVARSALLVLDPRAATAGHRNAHACYRLT